MRLVAALAMALLSMAYLRHFLNGGPEPLAKASLTSRRRCFKFCGVIHWLSIGQNAHPAP
jgi:hypothetical protein